MSERSEIETAAVARFLEAGFDEGFAPEEVSEAERAVIGRVLGYVEARFCQITYVLGLALDFTMAAQKLSEFDPEAKGFRPGLDEAALFARYPRTASAGTQNVNTLTLTFQHGTRTKKV